MGLQRLGQASPPASWASLPSYTVPDTYACLVEWILIDGSRGGEGSRWGGWSSLPDLPPDMTWVSRKRSHCSRVSRDLLT